jgi:hypothetical protein
MATRRLKRRRRTPVHTAKWDRCVTDVRRRGGAKSAAAVCTAVLGERGSILKKHRRRRVNPKRRKSHASGRWVILARKRDKPTHVFAGDRFLSERKGSLRGSRTVYFPSRELAARFARHLKRMFPTKLKGWRLRITILHPQAHPNADL